MNTFKKLLITVTSQIDDMAESLANNEAIARHELQRIRENIAQLKVKSKRYERVVEQAHEKIKIYSKMQEKLKLKIQEGKNQQNQEVLKEQYKQYKRINANIEHMEKHISNYQLQMEKDQSVILNLESKYIEFESKVNELLNREMKLCPKNELSYDLNRDCLSKWEEKIISEELTTDFYLDKDLALQSEVENDEIDNELKNFLDSLK